MSKRRQRADANLPLFDLPLQQDPVPPEPAQPPAPEPAQPPAAPTAGEESPGLAAANAAVTPAASPPAPAPAAAPAAMASQAPSTQPALFDAQGLEPNADETGGEIDDEMEFEEGFESEFPLVQDRLLSGLADLVLLTAAVGLMVLGTQLLGVHVTLQDWPPFLLFGLLLSFPYAVIPLAFWGQTPGMTWVGHAASSLDGEPLTFGQTVRRWIGALLTLALVGLPLLLAWNGGRSLADRVSESTTLQRG